MERSLPWLEIVGTAACPLVFLWFSFRKVSKERSRLLYRALSVIAALLVWAFSLFLLASRGCEEDRALIGSPDGKHVARLMIWGSVPTGTSIRVIERKSWSPFWREVSGGFTIGTIVEPIEPVLVWKDNSTLTIIYPFPAEGTSSQCETRKVEDILIECKTKRE